MLQISDVKYRKEPEKHTKIQYLEEKKQCCEKKSTKII